MIPGMSASALSIKGREQEGVARIKRFLSIMDSMNSDELDGMKPMNEGRITRVAKGSGNPIWEVRMLLDQHKQFAKMLTKMGKAGITKKGGPDISQMMRNPNQMLQNLQRTIDPRMLKQMGGAQGMMHLMKEIGENPDFAKNMLS
eukprot:Trichotokara_eunicae@DN5485_c0_g1_i1.p1